MLDFFQNYIVNEELSQELLKKQLFSQAMKNSGVVDLLARQIRPFTKNKEMHISSMSGIIAILSGFMNNVGALTVFFQTWSEKIFGLNFLRTFRPQPNKT